MSTLWYQFSLCAPLFALVLVGYGVMKLAGWPKSVSEGISRFVFAVLMPALLFRLLSDLSKLPPVDARLLIAFFGGCFVVFALGRLIAWKCFRLDGTGQSVFALGGIFCNNAMLGIPIARLILGDAALPAAALIIVFNALTLWTLISVSVEWSTHGSLSLAGFKKTLWSVLSNPIICSILLGSAWGLTGLKLPVPVQTTLDMVSSSAAPIALIALGMGLAEFGIGSSWRLPAAITILKLIIHPLAVGVIAVLLKLPALETNTVILMASISVGANVYLMARHFKALEGAVASSLVLSTLLAAITSPLITGLAHYLF